MLLPAASALILVLLTLVSPPAFGKSYFEVAQQMLDAGRETEARRALVQELRMRPDNLDARYNLAILMERLGDTQEAVRLYQENLRYGPHLASMINLSAIYRSRHEDAKAKLVLEKAAKHFRHEALPWYLLAEMAEEAGDVQQARKLYLKALAADPLNGFAHIRYARFLAAQRQFALARKHGRRAVRLLGQCAPCWRIYGDILQQAGEHKQALAAYQRSAALKPDRSIRLRIIAALEALGMHERAQRIRRALDAAGR